MAREKLSSRHLMELVMRSPVVEETNFLWCDIMTVTMTMTMTTTITTITSTITKTMAMSMSHLSCGTRLRYSATSPSSRERTSSFAGVSSA